jgi:hypothetical protein
MRLGPMCVILSLVRITALRANPESMFGPSVFLPFFGFSKDPVFFHGMVQRGQLAVVSVEHGRRRGEPDE